jgi:hypothetical protein
VIAAGVLFSFTAKMMLSSPPLPQVELLHKTKLGMVEDKEAKYCEPYLKWHWPRQLPAGQVDGKWRENKKA